MQEAPSIGPIQTDRRLVQPVQYYNVGSAETDIPAMGRLLGPSKGGAWLPVNHQPGRAFSGRQPVVPDLFGLAWQSWLSCRGILCNWSNSCVSKLLGLRCRLNLVATVVVKGWTLHDDGTPGHGSSADIYWDK